MPTPTLPLCLGKSFLNRVAISKASTSCQCDHPFISQQKLQEKQKNKKSLAQIRTKKCWEISSTLAQYK